MNGPENNPLADLEWHLRKADDDMIFGPVDKATLIEWSRSAQISPRDLISNDQVNWSAPHDFDFLEMVWVVALPEPKGTFYGPTSLGALKEFLARGVVLQNSLVTHYHTQRHLPLGALLVAEEAEHKRHMNQHDNSRTSLIMVDMAKDQRIRQLTEDLRELRAEHENLKQRYRQLQMQSEKR
jgi:hypothetical protein